ncbi:MAG: septum formation protein Maf [Anaerolineae bacterium]|nr:septum formation protein Maf [Anaerolineae bacterium]
MGKRVILLASGSPRRRELLGLTGLHFEHTTADIDETPHPGESAAAYTIRLSREKARAVLVAAAGDALVLAADTTVADGDVILGKPTGADGARAMLRQLRGRTHQVYTALTLIDAATGHAMTELAVTDVPMRNYTNAEIEAYIASGDPFDKAGGYAIQNAAFHPANLTSGCYANVVGLPLCHLVRALQAVGIEPDGDVPLRCQQHHLYDCDVTDDVLAGRL